MKGQGTCKRLLPCLVLLLGFAQMNTNAQTPTPQPTPRPPALVPRFQMRKSGLELERRTQAGTFVDIVGRRSAMLGYEHRGLEAWVYPLQILDNFELSFQLEGYPLEFRAVDAAVRINVRPEATTVTYSHAAFTVRQIIYAPVSEQGVIMLLDVESVLPLGITVSFRPRLKLMWPAGLMTGYIGYDEKEQVYYISEESKRFVGVVGMPAARDISLMPYQEEPRDVPARFHIDVPAESFRSNFIPVVIAGSTNGREEARATFYRLLTNARALYDRNVDYYRRLLEETASITTPDRRLNEAFQWAKVGTEKGIAENPLLGTGLVAGFRTAGESERPGFAWFFGRDSLWTSLALNSYGDFSTTRLALDFLRRYQRADGKIPHEISQGASELKWFTDYEYPWASADATPLFVIVHADYLRASGDLEYVRANWESVLKAYRFTAATDTDSNGLVENTKFGHGWVEGGALYPPHEEIYMQGLWVEATRSLAEMAEALGDAALAAEARAASERTRAAMEQTYWLQDRGFYAYATWRAPEKPRTAEPGPRRSLRQARMDAIDRSRLVDEDTVLPAVPLWWGTLEDARAQMQIDHLGSGHLVTDWGARIISEESQLYDPLSYHYGSVWPLFTGWASMGAYRYGRPHVGHQALMANALLTYGHALGYVTELLSGDFQSPFGRSSHHQVWSEAMVISPAMRGLLGLEAADGGRVLRFAPQLPADWDKVEARNVSVGAAHYDLALERAAGRMTVNVKRSAGLTQPVIETQPPATSSTPVPQGTPAPPGTTTPATGAPTPAPTPTPSTLTTPPGAATPPVAPLLTDTLARVIIAPAFPLDARVTSVTLGGRPIEFKVVRVGDVQRAEVTIDAAAVTLDAAAAGGAQVVFNYEGGTDVYFEQKAPEPGARSEGLRVLRSRAETDALRLTLEGLGGRSYKLRVRSTRQVGVAAGVAVARDKGPDPELTVKFDGPPDVYVRRELALPLTNPPAQKRTRRR